MNIRTLLPLLGVVTALAGCAEEKPEPGYTHHTCSEQSLQDGTCKNLSQVVLVTTENDDRCLDEAGIDPKRKPFIAQEAPGAYWVEYQADGATLRIDCTLYLPGR